MDVVSVNVLWPFKLKLLKLCKPFLVQIFVEMPENGIRDV